MRTARYLIIAILFAAGNEASYCQRISIPPTSRHTLGNGLTVILIEYRKVPLINLRLMVKSGSADDPDDLPGVADLTASLLREGTESRTSVQISEAIDFLGGSLSAGAGLDYSAVSLEVMKPDVDAGLDLFADVILRPSFPEEEIARERKQRIAGIDALKEDPSALASLMFRKAVFGDHPYGSQTTGTKASLGAITREHLTGFHGLAFVPNNAVLVAIGDLDSKEMLSKLTAAFGGWTRGEIRKRGLSTPPMRKGRTVVVVNKPDATQTQIRVGNTGIAAASMDFFPVIVGNVVFGGGFTSRLVDELRVKRSLTYGASSGFSTNLAGGLFGISTFTKTETTEETVGVVLEELRKFRDSGATEEEVEKARNYLSGSFARSLQSGAAIASRITDMELYGMPENYLEEYIVRIQNVGPLDVARIAKERFHQDDRVIVLLGPAEQIRATAEQFGEVTTVELDEIIK
jgi:zinc protease